MRLFAALFSLVLLAAAPAVPASAQQDAPTVKGLFLLTDYPAVTVRPGTTTTVNLRLRNYALPPERFALSVEGVPQGWTVTMLGGGQPVGAAMVATNDSTTPATAARRAGQRRDGHAEPHRPAQGQSNQGQPADRRHARQGPAGQAHDRAASCRRCAAPRSRASSISSRSRTTAAAISSSRSAAQAPQNFETSFTEQYGSQELSSLPVEAGQSKTVKLKVRPPSTIGANRYPVSVKASAEDASADAKRRSRDHRSAAAVHGRPRRRAQRPRRGR